MWPGRAVLTARRDGREFHTAVVNWPELAVWRPEVTRGDVTGGEGRTTQGEERANHPDVT